MYCTACNIRLGTHERRIVDGDKAYHLACNPLHGQKRRRLDLVERYLRRESKQLYEQARLERL